jgi:hypothetical protein
MDGVDVHLRVALGPGYDKDRPGGRPVQLAATFR